MHRVGQLFLSGDLIESERLAREAAHSAEKLMGITAFVHLVAQLFQVGLELTGTDAERVLGEAQAGAERILTIAPSYHVMHTLRARAALGHGQPHIAEQYLASQADPVAHGVAFRALLQMHPEARKQLPYVTGAARF